MKKAILAVSALMIAITACTSQNEKDQETASLYEDEKMVRVAVDRTKIRKPGSQGGN
ncbi:hypothetical protein [Ascidiimonas aurantiaca]|uniref:hypothetical protein n=1 Tax=Ascidiimonas aurantiaca TaxID=1685432 RepID=UPI0030EBE179